MACSHNRAKFSLLNRHRVRHPIPCAVRGCGDLNYTTNIFRGPYVGRQTDVRQKHRLMPLPYLNAYHGIWWNRLCTFYTILLTNIQTNKRRWNHNLLGGVNKDSYIYICFLAYAAQFVIRCNYILRARLISIALSSLWLTFFCAKCLWLKYSSFCVYWETCHREIFSLLMSLCVYEIVFTFVACL